MAKLDVGFKPTGAFEAHIKIDGVTIGTLHLDPVKAAEVFAKSTSTEYDDDAVALLKTFVPRITDKLPKIEAMEVANPDTA